VDREEKMKGCSKEWFYKLYKGKIQSYVARGEESLTKICKTMETAMEKGHVSKQDLEKMLIEVEIESVKPFIQDNYAIRHTRLEDIKRSIWIET